MTGTPILPAHQPLPATVHRVQGQALNLLTPGVRALMAHYHYCKARAESVVTWKCGCCTFIQSRFVLPFQARICLTVQKTWTQDVPALAMEYQPLLNSIMSLSILYLKYVGDTSGILKPEQLEQYGAQYLEATLQELRQALGGMDSRTADAASYTSVILAFHAFANLRERDFRPYTAPNQWLQMCLGVKNVFRAAIPIVRDIPEAKLNNVLAKNAWFVEPSKIFCEANRSRLSHLLANAANDPGWETDRETYSTTLCYLGGLVVRPGKR